MKKKTHVDLWQLKAKKKNNIVLDFFLTQKSC